MLRFFRKLRHQLILSGQSRKYLLYVVGEVLLIVVGILIALTINNRNETRLTRQKEQVYLAGLENEFQTSRVKLQELIKVNRSNYEGAKRIIGYIDRPDSLPDERTLSHLLYQSLAYDLYYTPNNSLLGEMINSGSLKDLSNDELRRRLTNWIASVEHVNAQERDLKHQKDQVLQLLRGEPYSLRTLADQTQLSGNLLHLPASQHVHSNLPILQSRAFENNLLLYILSSQLTETEHYQPLLDELEMIIDLIAEERI